MSQSGPSDGAALPPPGVGPRTGSDPLNSAQEVAVLRAEVVALRDRLEERWAAHRREHAMLAQAIDKAERSMGTRLEAMNEFRAQLTVERAQFATREQTTNNSDKLIKLEGDVSGLREDLSALKSGQEWVVRVVAGAVITGAIGFLFAVLRP